MENQNNNRISAELNPEIVSEIRGLIQQITEKLPFLMTLTKKEQDAIPELNRSNKLFIDDALRTAENNSSILPSYVDISELRKDLELYESLGKILLPLSLLQKKVLDTQRLAGAEGYTSALVIYNMYQMAAKMGVDGTETLVAKLAQRIKGYSENEFS